MQGLAAFKRDGGISEGKKRQERRTHSYEGQATVLRPGQDQVDGLGGGTHDQPEIFIN